VVPQRPGDEAASKGGQLQGLLGGGQGEGVAAAGAPVVQGQVLRDLPPRMVTSDSCLAGSPSWTVAGPPRKEPEFLQCLRFSFFFLLFLEGNAPVIVCLSICSTTNWKWI